MIKIILLSLSFIFFSLGSLKSQVSFSPFNVGSPNLLIGTPFVKVSKGSTAWADIDGDNDMDVLVTGLNTSNQKVAKLYTNDGSGAFNLVTGTPFDGVDEGDIAFADIDGDNDMDVLITGASSTTRIAKLYVNDGTGIFTEVIGTPFDGAWRGSLAFTDVDGDNDQDVLITGFNNSGNGNSKLYINNGTGSFTEQFGTPFDSVGVSAIAFEDIDGDNDQDLILTGFNSAKYRITKLYVNNGTGGFSEVLNTPFIGVRQGSVTFADVDGDNDQDVFITGQSSSGLKSILYTNNGTGVFTTAIGSTFKGVYRSSCKFADIDGDNDPDLIITGSNSTNWSKLYTNDGTGLFTEIPNTPFVAVSYSSVTFEDVDNDNDPDLLITGQTNSYAPFTTLYSNNGSGEFIAVTGTPFTGVYQSDIAFADIDGDNDQDVIIVGNRGSNSLSTKLFANNGIGIFTEIADTVFNQIQYGPVGFLDFDEDNDLDLLLKNVLYTNDGTGNFTKAMNSPFSGVSGVSFDFADVDGDNDKDLLISGFGTSQNHITKLYTNNGSGSYTETAGTPFSNRIFNSINLKDFDGDNDLDLIALGTDPLGIPCTYLYTNNGTGVFTLVTGTSFMEITNGSIDFADIDGDNDLDIFITGTNTTYPGSAKFYINDGFGVFTEVNANPIQGVGYSDVAFFDVDNDNDQDLIVTGKPTSNSRFTTLYLNDGAGNFTKELNTPFDDIAYGAIACTDVDNDTDIDLLITGSNASNQLIALGYQNNLFAPCIPTHSTLTVIECDSFLFNGIYYTGNNSTATDTLINAEGCDSIITLNLTIDTVDVSVGMTLQNTMRANLSGATYQWLNCDSLFSPIIGETDQNFTPTQNGNYAVIVDNGTCSDTSECIFVTNVGITNLENENRISAYPNPTTNSINLNLGNITNAAISLKTVSGKIIQSKNNGNNQIITISLERYPPGIYLLEIQSNHQYRMIKIVKM